MKVDGIEIQIQSDVSKAIKGINMLDSSMTRLSRKVQKFNSIGLAQIGKNASASTRGVSDLSSRLSALSGNFTTAHRSMKSFSQTAGSFYVNCFLMIRGLKKLGGAISSSMDYVETYNYFNVITDKIGKEFGSAWEENGYTSADAYTKSFRDRLNDLNTKMTGFKVGEAGDLSFTDSVGLGLDPEQIMNFQASISAITNAVGLCGETSINTADALGRLSADLSSLKNVDLETVMTNLSSGLIGQSRALYKYGIDITNTKLAEYALAEGIKKKVSEMTQAEKMQLRMLAILDQSKIAWGDQANSINTVANQYRILQQQTSNLARIFGNLFVPILQKVLPYINGFVVALQRLFVWFGNLIGIDYKSLMSGISSGYNDAGLEALGDNADSTADSLDEAEKAAKKLKRTIHSYDELHVATDPSSGKDKNSETGSSIDLSGNIGAALGEYKSVWDKAFSDMENKINEVADSISAFGKKAWDAIEPFRKSIVNLANNGLKMLTSYSFEALKDFYNEFLVPIGEWAFGTEGEGLTRLVDVINNSLMKIDWLWITENLKEFWKAIEPYAEQFGEGLIDFFEDLSNIAVDIINKLFGKNSAFTTLIESLKNGDPESARKWGYALGVFALGLMAFKGIATILSGLAALGTAFATLSTGLGALFGGGGLFAKIGSGVAKFGSTIGSAGTALVRFGGNIIQMFARWTGGAETFAESFIAIFGTGGVIAVAVAAIAAFVAGLVYAYNTSEEVRNSVANGVSALKEGLKPILEYISNKVIPDIKDGWNGLIEILRPIGEFLKGAFVSIWLDVLCPAMETIGNEVLPKLGEAFKALWEGVIVPFANLMKSVLAPVIEIVAEVLTILWKNVIAPLANVIMTVFLKAISALATYFTEVFVPRIKGVIEIVQFIWDKGLNPLIQKLKEYFLPQFRVLCETVKWIIDGLKDVFMGVIDFITGVFTGDWEKAWSGIKQIFTGIMNGIISIIEGVINGFLEGLNWVTSKVNGISDKFNGSIHIDQFSTVSLPRMANGGILNKGQAFIAREKGAEMIGGFGNQTGVINNDQIVDTLKGALIDGMMQVSMATSGNSKDSDNRPVQIFLDGRVIAESTYSQFRSMSTQGLIPKMA